jgi:hypothetical protein
MSAFGPKRTFPYVAFDVAFGGKADIASKHALPVSCPRPYDLS